MNYGRLKKMLNAIAEVNAGGLGFGVAHANERVTSLTMTQTTDAGDAMFEGKSVTEADWLKFLDLECEKVDEFTQARAMDIMRQSEALETSLSEDMPESKRKKKLAGAALLGNEFLKLEKFVNLNYMGFHKILKKHDKVLPHSPCKDFYIQRMHTMKWVKNNYSKVFVHISRLMSRLRDDQAGEKSDNSAQEFVRKTTKYWVRTEDISKVKYEVLKHLPVFQFDEAVLDIGDSQLTNSVYMDNILLDLYHGRINKDAQSQAIRLRWYGTGDPKLVFVERKTHKDSWTGEVSVKERFTLKEKNVVPFLRGEYTLDMCLKEMREKNKSEEEIESVTRLFTEIYATIEAKQLQPMMRTQYMRVAYQIPFNQTVRVSLDTNLHMIMENAEGAPSCLESGLWYRDPALPVPRTEMTRFPHAVLEVKLALKEGDEPPAWVDALINSGMLCEVHKFSKFLHGCATLIEDHVREVPYWIDDASIQTSMHRSRRVDSVAIQLDDVEAKVHQNNPPLSHNQRGRKEAKSFRNDPMKNNLNQPLLESDGLQFMGNAGAGSYVPPLGSSALQNGGRRELSFSGQAETTECFGFLSKKKSKGKPRKMPMRIEPKTYFANERTFLSWLHMAVTLGSIGGFKFIMDNKGCPERQKWEQYGGIVMLVVAIIFIMYALRLYMWRSKMIRERRMGPFDDRFGPFALSFILFIAFGFVLTIDITSSKICK